MAPLLNKAVAIREMPRSVIQYGAAVYTPDVAATPRMVQSGITLSFVAGLVFESLDLKPDLGNLGRLCSAVPLEY